LSKVSNFGIRLPESGGTCQISTITLAGGILLILESGSCHQNPTTSSHHIFMDL
jgi:hypothetical protein